MIKALLLIFEPDAAWGRVVRIRRSVGYILTVYLMPLLLLTSVAEGAGLVLWGKSLRGTTYLKEYTPKEAITYEVGQLLLTLGIVFLAARVIKTLGETFHGRHSYTQAFTTVVYGLSPLFACRVLDAFSGVNPWLSWGIGIILSVTILYQGVPRVMLPDPPHAFGLYIVTAVLLTIVTGMARLVTAWYLTGEFRPIKQVMSALAHTLS